MKIRVNPRDFWPRAAGCLIMVFTALSACGPAGHMETREAQQAILQDAIYADLQAVEELFEIPAGSETIAMGVYDVFSGTFSGKTSSHEVIFIGNKPKIIEIPPTEDIDAVYVQLRFDFQYHGSELLQVTVNDRVYEVPVFQSSITIDVGRAQRINWRIEESGNVVEDTIIIHRPNVIGAGAFTVEAFPISILYEPPQYGSSLSRAIVGVANSVGSSMSTSESQESIETRTKFVGWSSYVDKMNQVSGILESLGAESAVLDAVSGLLSGMGTYSVTETEGTKVSEEHTVDLLTTQSMRDTTSNGFGPGRGDIIMYLKDVQVAWVMIRGELSLSILGWGERHAYTAERLKSDLEIIESGGPAHTTQTGLSEKSLRSLLSLDPFVAGGQQTELGEERYEYIGEFCGDSSVTLQVQHTIRQTDRTREQSYSAKLNDYEPGWLSVLGLCSSDAESLKLVTTHSSSRQLQVGQTVSASLEINADYEHPYKLRVHYDVVFGTFTAVEIGGLLGSRPSIGNLTRLARAR